MSCSPKTVRICALLIVAFIALPWVSLIPSPAPVEQETPPVAFCLPPARKKAPPPLPVMPECAVNLSNAVLHSVMTLKPQGDEWVVTLDTVPMADMPALQVRDDGDGTGSVHDLRWHGRAGVARATRRTWKQKPGQA